MLHYGGCANIGAKISSSCPCSHTSPSLFKWHRNQACIPSHEPQPATGWQLWVGHSAIMKPIKRNVLTCYRGFRRLLQPPRFDSHQSTERGQTHPVLAPKGKHSGQRGRGSLVRPAVLLSRNPPQGPFWETQGPGCMETRKGITHGAGG